MTRLFTTLLIAAAFPGCASRLPPFATPPTHLQTELFLGTRKPDGSTVSSREIQAFINTEIVPRFPDGFTIFDAQGWWRAPGGATTREHTKILHIVHQPRDAQKINAIRERYKARFQQESVLEVTLPVKARF